MGIRRIQVLLKAQKHLPNLLRPAQVLGGVIDRAVFQFQKLLLELELTRFGGHIWTLEFRPRLFRTLR